MADSLDGFMQSMGVKQGCVLSPILFCICLDRLLKTLCSSNIGFVGRMFTGTLAYADDIVLLAPTAQAVRLMLLVCEKYAAKFGVVFSATKSKCIVCTAPFSKLAQDLTSYCKFTIISGNEIEFVQSWAHLGHIVSSTMDDENDIARCRHNLIGKLNEVLSTFRELDSFVKVRLLKNYCPSLYGCELWNLRHASVEYICKPRRSALKSAW